MRRRSRPKPAATLLAAGIATLLFRAVEAGDITLSQFQEISGFPSGCENAYNTPLTDCTAADFASASSACSPQCFNDLKQVTTNINIACSGLTADPTTLIGMFFEGQGAAAVCPTVSGGTTSGTGSNDGTSGNSGSGNVITIIGATTLPPSQPSIINNPPPAAVSTSIEILSAAATTSTTADSSLTTSSVPLRSMTVGQGTSTTVQPATSTVGAGSVSAVTAGAAAATSLSPTSGAGTFGGGAIPFFDLSTNAGERTLAPSRCASAAAVAVAAWFLSVMV